MLTLKKFVPSKGLFHNFHLDVFSARCHSRFLLQNVWPIERTPGDITSKQATGVWLIDPAGNLTDDAGGIPVGVDGLTAGTAGRERSRGSSVQEERQESGVKRSRRCQRSP